MTVGHEDQSPLTNNYHLRCLYIIITAYQACDLKYCAKNQGFFKHNWLVVIQFVKYLISLFRSEAESLGGKEQRAGRSHDLCFCNITATSEENK